HPAGARPDRELLPGGRDRCRRVLPAPRAGRRRDHRTGTGRPAQAAHRTVLCGRSAAPAGGDPGAADAGRHRAETYEPDGGAGGGVMKALFPTWAWPSHFFPMVPLAWALRAAGHEVRVASGPELAGTIRASGLPAVSVGTPVDFAGEFRARF